MRKQHYMTEQERHQLEAMRRNKIPVREIARQLGFCERTIYYELKRGSYIHTCKYWDETRYSAQKGQQIHRYNQTAKGRPLKIGSDHTFAAYIEHKIIVDRYSPAAALAAARRYNFQTRICVSTLYSYIDKRLSDPDQQAPMGQAEEEAEEGRYREAHRAPEATQHRDPARIHRTAL